MRLEIGVMDALEMVLTKHIWCLRIHENSLLIFVFFHECTIHAYAKSTVSYFQW